MRRTFGLVCCTSAIAFAFGSSIEAETTVRFATNLGDFNVSLFDETASNTVANFLNYVADGDYVDSIVHRSVPDFVIQGGGYYSDFSAVPADPPIANEFGASNLRGTIAMARTDDPNSATSQWFINLADNLFLDTQFGGFTVFGEVVAPGMTTVDQIAALDTIGEARPFGELPVLDASMGTEANNLVTIQSVTIIPELPNLLGDMDFDGDRDFDDIDDFILGLQFPGAYEAQYGVPPSVHGDADMDGDQDFDDIDEFVVLLNAVPAKGIPEPGTLILVLIALAAMATPPLTPVLPVGPWSGL